MICTAPPPSSVIFRPPSMTVFLFDGTLSVAVTRIVTGSTPQLNVMTPPAVTAACSAANVQLAAVPVPPAPTPPPPGPLPAAPLEPPLPPSEAPSPQPAPTTVRRPANVQANVYESGRAMDLVMRSPFGLVPTPECHVGTGRRYGVVH